MLRRFNPLRLSLEILLAIGLAELTVMYVLPAVAPNLGTLAEGFFGIALLAMLAGPAISWRVYVANRHTANRDASEQKVKRAGRWTIAVSVAAQLCALFLAAWVVSNQYQSLKEAQKNEWGNLADRMVLDVERRFNRPVHGLLGLHATSSSFGRFSRLPFRQWVEARDAMEQFPGIRGVGRLDRVFREQLAEFVAAEQADGAPDFQVRTSGDKPDLFVVTQIEPQELNWQAVGYDIGSEPKRRAAVELAMNTGNPILSAPIVLQQDEKKTPGFLYVFPEYGRGKDPQTLLQRRQAFTGVFFVPIVAAELLDGLKNVGAGALNFRVVDASETPNPLVFSSFPEGLEPGTEHVLHRKVLVGNRTLSLEFYPVEAGLSQNALSGLVLLSLLGALASCLVGVATWLMVSGRERALALAESMTQEIEQLARVVRHTDNAVTLMSPDMRIQWVNEGFTRMTGFALEEARGSTPEELLGTGKSDAAAIASLVDGMKEGKPAHAEMLNRRKDGKEYWVDTEVRPTFSADGRLTGFMELGTDITQKKESRYQLEAALRDSELLLNAVSLHAIVSVADSKGKIIEVNQAFCEVSGYSREELLGEDHRLVSSGIHPASFWEEMWATICAGTIWRRDICNRAKDGRLFWVDSLIAPFIGDDGQVEKYVSIRTDITDRLRNQALLEEMSSRMRLAVEGGSDGLWDWMDLEQEAQWWSPSYYGLLGYTPQEMPATVSNYRALLHPESLALSTRASKAAIDGDSVFDIEIQIRTRDQGYRWFRNRAKVYRDSQGRAVRMAGSTQDIQERKLAEEKAQRSAEILRNSIEALDDAFVLYDDQDRLVMFNQRYKEFYPETAVMLEPGNTFEEIIRYGVERGQYQNAVGREEEWVKERLALHRQEHSRMQQTTRGGRTLRVVERRTPDGYIVGFRVDVTDLVRATEAAEEASRSKSQFLANMSHEIRTPMNAILGMLKLLQNTELTGTQLDYAVKAEGAARSLLGLLNDILDFSKVEAGKMTLDPRPFRLDRLMRDLSVILSANVGQRAIEVLFDIAPDVPKALVGDDMRLLQVLINLGGNAIKFTQSGEVILRLRLKRLADGIAHIEFAMQDSGIGIAPENQARIFSGFSQAEANTTRRFGGTGLGLAISKRLIELMQGELSLRSEVGAGSTFFFDIPLAVDVAETALAPAAELPQAVLALRTLVVDDNAVAREIMQHMVESLGWRADTAASGAQAVTMVERALEGGEPYRAIFMDWQMPHMDGWRTSERIREICAARREGLQDVPNPLILMITAHSRDMLAQRNAREHALLNGFLVKPVTASMLVDAVQDALSAELTASTGINPVALHVPDKPRRLQGLRLLVVEDNKINQLVAQGLLTQEGAEVTLAEDGQKGVDAVANTTPAFDLVLMDLQMPVMDGYDATRAIRQLLGNSGLPIVAMTANAMASDKAACLAAGMNDHVGKPFELDELVRVVLHHAGSMPVASGPVDRMPVEAPKPAPPVTEGPVVLDVETALGRMGGDATVFAQVILSFAKDLQPMLAQVRTHLQNNELPHAQRVLHTLKGLAATVGAMQLSLAAAQLEAHCKSGGEPAGAEARLAQLDESVALAEAALAEAAQRFSPVQASSVPAHATGVLDAHLQDGLLQLENLLLQNDMSALEHFAQLSGPLSEALGSACEPLAEAMASLDFALAAQICQSLR